MTSTIRILLIDDHSLFRESLGRLLQTEPGIQLAGSVSGLRDAVTLIRSDPPDVVLLDFDLGSHHGLQVVSELRDLNYKGRILMVTAGMRQPDIARALENGVAGIFLKHSPPAELVTAIRRVANDEIWLDPRTVSALAATAHRQYTPSAPALSDRERTVLNGVFDGLTNKEIAARMNISESYVKAVLQQLFEKTGVRTRGQLVRVALERQIGMNNR